MLTNTGMAGYLVLLIYFIVLPLCFWQIFKKAGYQGFWGLFAIVPLGALALLLSLAFVDWPDGRKA